MAVVESRTIKDSHHLLCQMFFFDEVAFAFLKGRLIKFLRAKCENNQFLKVRNFYSYAKITIL